MADSLIMLAEGLVTRVMLSILIYPLTKRAKWPIVPVLPSKLALFVLPLVFFGSPHLALFGFFAVDLLAIPARLLRRL